MTVYKVYDDQWEGIMGSGQLKEFCFDQTHEFLNTYEEEYDKDSIEALSDLAKDVLEDVKTGVTETSFVDNVSNIVAIELLKLRYFDVDELNIY